MRPYLTLAEMLAPSLDDDWRRREERGQQQYRAIIEARGERTSILARLEAAARNLVQPEHSLTDYPCRLPDGRMGRVAVIEQNGDWTMACRLA
jgi:hypothetical protein